MTAHNDLDRQLTDFLRDGPEELPYESFDAVRDRTESTRQRVVLGPWRLPEMNKIVTIGLGAAAVVVLLIVGAQFFGSSPGGIGNAPSPSVAEPTATPEPSASSTYPPPLAQTFTSTQHGISMSYPEGWDARAATEPWTVSEFPLNFEAPEVDVLYDPDLGSGGPFLIFASQPIGDSTPEDWVAEQMASPEGCGAPAGPITVDGAEGGGGGSCSVVAVATADRGYWIQRYTGSETPLFNEVGWFDEVLATVQLQPEDAVD